MSDVLKVGVSALIANQTGLRTVGNNIANTNTEGYSRQEVIFNDRPSNAIGSVGFIGSGVNIEGIRRVVNEYVQAELNIATNNFSKMDRLFNNAVQLDQFLGDEATSLSPTLRKFFESIQSAAETNPTSIANRQLLLSEAELLVNRIQSMQGNLDDQNHALNLQIESTVDNINTITTQIALMNKKISEYSVDGEFNQPNELLDQREKHVNNLASLIDIQVVTDNNGAFNVFAAGGNNIVVGNRAYQLNTDTNDTDSSRLDVTHELLNINNNITNQITGGELGGMLQFRKDILDTVYNRLGLITTTLMELVNAQHRRGMDLNNELGEDFFSNVNETSLARRRVQEGYDNPEPNDQVIEVKIDELTDLVASDYILNFSNNDPDRYSITRVSDNTVVAENVLSGVFPSTNNFDGLTVDLVSGTYQEGASFRLMPFRNMAEEISVNIVNVRNISLSQPIRTDASSSNLGTASVSQGVVLDADTIGFDRDNNELTPPLIIEFVSDTRYDVLDNSDPANPVHLQPPLINRPYIVGITNNIFSEDVNQTGVTSSGPAISQFVTATIDNGYPLEEIVFTSLNPDTGVISRQTHTTSANDSAETIAQALNLFSGVEATSRNYAEISNISSVTPMTLSLNGELLSGVDADSISDSINSNINLSDLGISAKTDGATISVRASTGVDFTFEVGGAGAGDSVTITNEDGGVANIVATAVNPRATIGGKIDVFMDGDVSIRGGGNLFNILPNAVSTYRGYQVSIDGLPDAGDRFTIEYNTDGHSDNRNALALAEIQTLKILNGNEQSLHENYTGLVNIIGTKTYEAEISLEASESILNRIESERDNISGVNMDEEALFLMQFEQAYNAAAQLISIARSTFDTLIRSSGG